MADKEDHSVDAGERPSLRREGGSVVGAGLVHEADVATHGYGLAATRRGGREERRCGGGSGWHHVRPGRRRDGRRPSRIQGRRPHQPGYSQRRGRPAACRGRYGQAAGRCAHERKRALGELGGPARQCDRRCLVFRRGRRRGDCGNTVGHEQSCWPSAGHVLHRRQSVAAIHRLFNDRADLSLFSWRAVVSIRLRPQLFEIRVCQSESFNVCATGRRPSAR